MRFVVAIIISLSSFNLSAQYVSINEILDANLFKLADGRIVKLAGVDAPSCSSSIPYLRKVADYAKSMMNLYYHTNLNLDSISYNNSGNYLLVFLYRKYPIGKLNLSERLLDNGYGKYIENFRSLDSVDLQSAEKHAKESQQGIWKYYSPSSDEIIDPMLTNDRTASVLIPDSVKFYNNYPSRSIFLSIPLELVSGTAFTFGSMLVGGGVGYILNTKDKWSGLGGALIGLAAGYFIGFPWMIYEVAKGENPNLNIWINFSWSWGLTLATGLLAYEKDNQTLSWVAGLSPIIGSLLYTHLLAPQAPVKDNSFLQPDSKITTFKDYRNSKTVNLEFFRINF